MVYLVEAQGARRHDLGTVRHDAHLVQRGLAVEEDNVAVSQVALHNVPHLQLLRLFFQVAKLEGACKIAVNNNTQVVHQSCAKPAKLLTCKRLVSSAASSCVRRVGNDCIGARVGGPVAHIGAQALNVGGVDSLREGEDLGHALRHTDLLQPQVRVRRND